MYKFINDVNVETDGISEVTHCLDVDTSLYMYQWCIEMYSSTSDICYSDLVQILPSEYVESYCETPYTFIVIPKSNEVNATSYVFHCNQAYSYYYDFEDGTGYHYSCFSGSWENDEYPTDVGVYSGQYITFCIPTGSYPAGTYVCTGADWETLI